MVDGIMGPAPFHHFLFFLYISYTYNVVFSREIKKEFVNFNIANTLIG
ncbi:hypothetical protein D1AOALGA4SA_2892 [Olavius algarvensis Delta 1 endosymbiont]|nr:hypothetical protein D1AOALGA4SA_2892 [Olavius algarvensis Delta 1 endosymbiont]